MSIYFVYIYGIYLKYLLEGIYYCADCDITVGFIHQNRANWNVSLLLARISVCSSLYHMYVQNFIYFVSQ